MASDKRGRQPRDPRNTGSFRRLPRSSGAGARTGPEPRPTAGPRRGDFEYDDVRYEPAGYDEPRYGNPVRDPRYGGPRPEPGYPDRGHGPDPEFRNGERPGPGHGDLGYAEPGYTEPGYTEPGYAEPGYAGQWRSEPGYAEPGYAEPRDSDPRRVDSRYPDARFGGAGRDGPGYGEARPSEPPYPGLDPLRRNGSPAGEPPASVAPLRPGQQRSDPRFGLPSTGEDVQMTTDPRASSERRLSSDPRLTDLRLTDPRLTDPRFADPRFADPRQADPRFADPRAGDPSLADPRLADPWDLAGQVKPASQRRSAGRMLAIEPPRPAGPMPISDPAGSSDLAGWSDPAGRPDPGRPPEQPRRPGENTRSVHLPLPPVPAQQPLATPIYRTAAFAFSSSAEYASVLADITPGFSYSRIDNPTVEAFCSAVAALEGVNLSYPVASQAFASGMAAISTLFWTLTRAGAHVIAPAAVYGGTYSFLRNVAANFGVQTDFVDMTDLGQVKAALRSTTSVVYAETLANPTVAVADVASLARLAHEAGAMLVVDSTLAPPVVCRPLEHGADLVVHSATKYFGGHSDVTGGVITGRPELVKSIRRIRIDTGGSLAPDDAYLLRRGLETLPLRVRRQCATAQVVAAGLARHPAVRTVYYPGLTQHRGHELARRQFDAGPEGTRFGAIVTVAPYGGHDAGLAFADRLRIAQVATSLGGTHTKVSHVASTTHRQMDQAALTAAGIDPGSVRFSIGLEDGEDLLADAMAALDSLSRR